MSRQRPGTPNWILQNGPLSKSSLCFREIMFNKYEFPAGTLVLNTRYKHLGHQNNNLFYPFNDQFDYILAYYFAELETTKRNIGKFLSNLLIKLITKNFSYCNSDE